METAFHDLNVLLIHAPVHHPACLPWRGALVASKLAAFFPDLQIFDAGLDFLRQVVADQDALIRLQSPDGSRPEVIIRDLRAWDLGMETVTAAYRAVRLHRNGCSFPGLHSIDDVLAFRADPQINPFYGYALEQWHPFVSSRAPDVGVLSVGAAGQIPAAATLAMAWYQRWPGIPLLCAGIGDLPAEGRKKLFYEDRLASCTADMRRLAGQLAGMQTAGPSEENTIQAPLEHPAGCQALLERPLLVDRIPDDARAAARQGRRLIIWRSGSDAVGAIGRQLHAVAREGIWNHLILGQGHDDDLGKFAMANANIVHSWCRLEPALTPFSDPVCRYPEYTPPYGETKPMPGLPLWMALRDPVFIQSCLQHFDLGTLMRQRHRDDRQSFFEVGQNLRYHYVRPQDLPDGYLEEIVHMVAAGGSVNTRYVKHNLQRAYLVAYAEEEGVIIGNSSLKHPRDEYIDAVSRQSGIDLHNFLERGYTSVRPEYRGLGVGAQLLAGLTERAGGYKIFSVIAEDNIATQKMARRNRTLRVATFFSQKANKQVSVWIPEWMVPEGIVLPEQPDV